VEINKICRGTALLLLIGSTLMIQDPTFVVSAGQKTNPCDLCGLYYLDGNEDSRLAALVISSDDQPIPPKLNDPNAPTRPGLHFGTTYFRFVSSKLLNQNFRFHTARVNGTEFLFHGQFGHENVPDLAPQNVPYVSGVLIEKKNGHVTRSRKVRFTHAVIY
jgi:hypothetical protein